MTQSRRALTTRRISPSATSGDSRCEIVNALTSASKLARRRTVARRRRRRPTARPHSRRARACPPDASSAIASAPTRRNARHTAPSRRRRPAPGSRAVLAGDSTMQHRAAGRRGATVRLAQASPARSYARRSSVTRAHSQIRGAPRRDGRSTTRTRWCRRSCPRRAAGIRRRGRHASCAPHHDDVSTPAASSEARYAVIASSFNSGSRSQLTARYQARSTSGGP